jgi:hypothetical protein
VSSHLEERDVVEIKKALATSGADKERAASSAAGRLCLLLHVNPTHVSPSLVDCMLLPGLDPDDPREQGRPVRLPASTQEIDRPVVCRFRPKLFHELSPIVHPVDCLLRLCRLCQETGDNIIPRFRRSRRQAVVPNQLLARQCHLHRVKKLGESSSYT